MLRTATGRPVCRARQQVPQGAPPGTSGRWESPPSVGKGELGSRTGCPPLSPTVHRIMTTQSRDVCVGSVRFVCPRPRSRTHLASSSLRRTHRSHTCVMLMPSVLRTAPAAIRVAHTSLALRHTTPHHTHMQYVWHCPLLLCHRFHPPPSHSSVTAQPCPQTSPPVAGRPSAPFLPPPMPSLPFRPAPHWGGQRHTPGEAACASH